jgi:optic atrophy 3 protein
MLPFFKVLSLLLRMFTRPFSNYLKNSLKHKHDHHPFVKDSILRLGQFYHRVQIRIQRRVMNMSSSDSYVKPLPDDKALESGAEFIGEIVAYGTLIVWGVYEIDKYGNEAKEKEIKQQQVFANIHARLEGIESGFKEMMGKVEEERKIREERKECGTDTEED